MHLNTCEANTMSQLCVRVSAAESAANIPLVITPVGQSRRSLNSWDKMNKLCNRISNLESALQIKHRKSGNSLGPSTLSTKVNELSGRVSQIEKAL
jgi:hypothetical protein